MIETPYLQGGSIKVIGEFPTYFWVTLPLTAKDFYFCTIPWLHLKKYEFVISYSVTPTY